METLAEADGALEEGRYEETDVGLTAATEPIQACFNEGCRLKAVAKKVRAHRDLTDSHYQIKARGFNPEGRTFPNR